MHKIKRNMYIIPIIIASCYLFILFGFYLFQNKFIFFPQKLSHGADQILKNKSNEITINIDSVTIHGWLINKGKKNLIIYYGGNAEEVSYNIDDFKRLYNYSTLLLNYRGYGKSDGRPSQEHLFNDALKIFDYITHELNISVDNVVLFGRSIGSGIAIYVASKRKVKHLILVTPFDSIRNIVKDKLLIFPVDLILKHPFNSLSYTENIMCSSLILIAEYDEIIKYKYSINLVNNWRGDCKHCIIKNAGHNNIHTYTEYWDLITNYLNH